MKKVNKDKINVLVSAVGAAPGRNVSRTLAQHQDIRVVACEANPLAVVLYDRSETDAGYVMPFANDVEAYMDAIYNIIEKEKIDVIIPCVETEIYIISKYKKALKERGAHLICEDYDRIQRLTNKENLVAIACRLGLPFIKTYAFKALFDKTELIDFPIIAKPKLSHGARGVKIINDQQELDLCLSLLEGKEEEYVIQQYIPGEVGTVFLCALLYSKEGKIISRFLSRSIKTLFPFGGPAFGGEAVKGFDRLIDYGEALVNEVGGWYGPINFEFKISATDGMPYLLDANPRFWGYGRLAVASGLDFPYMAVCDAVRKPCEHPESYTDDVVLLRDLDDRIIPRATLLPPDHIKTIGVCQIDQVDENTQKHIETLLSIKSVDQVVLTGSTETFKKVPKHLLSERCSFYTKQVASDQENLKEITLYYSAKIAFTLKDQENLPSSQECSSRIEEFWKSEKMEDQTDSMYLIKR